MGIETGGTITNLGTAPFSGNIANLIDANSSTSVGWGKAVPDNATIPISFKIDLGAVCSYSQINLTFTINGNFVGITITDDTGTIYTSPNPASSPIVATFGTPRRTQYITLVGGLARATYQYIYMNGFVITGTRPGVVIYTSAGLQSLKTDSSSSVKVYLGTVTGLKVVEVTDSTASKVRVMTASGVKAIAKY